MLGIRLLIGDCTVAPAAADTVYLAAAETARRRTCRERCAARTEYQYLFALHIDPRMLCKTAHTVKIGIIAVQPAVAPHDGIYRADVRCGGVYPVEQRHYLLLIGNSHIQSAKVALADKVDKTSARYLAQGVAVFSYHAVYHGGKAVPQSLSYKSEFHNCSFAVPYARPPAAERVCPITSIVNSGPPEPFCFNLFFIFPRANRCRSAPRAYPRALSPSCCQRLSAPCELWRGRVCRVS